MSTDCASEHQRQKYIHIKKKKTWIWIFFSQSFILYFEEWRLWHYGVGFCCTYDFVTDWLTAQTCDYCSHRKILLFYKKKWAIVLNLVSAHSVASSSGAPTSGTCPRTTEFRSARSNASALARASSLRRTQPRSTGLQTGQKRHAVANECIQTGRHTLRPHKGDVWNVTLVDCS